MMGRTHLLAGIASLGVLALVPGALSPDGIGVLAPFAALGALLPDLDAADSRIKRLKVAGVTPFSPVSVLLHRTLGHRGALHSLLALVIFSLLVLPLGLSFGLAVPAALTLGYASHLVADACTKSGIPLLFPRRVRYHLLPRPLRLTTGSPAEEAVFALLGVLIIGLLLRQLSANASFSP